MRSLRFLSCLAVLSIWAAGAAVALGADSSIEGSIEGRTAARTFVEFLSPKMCAVVLERPQCKTDFQRMRFAFAPAELAAVDRWLADGDVRHRLTAYSAYVPPDTLWATDATFAWWLHASAETMLAGAGGAPIENYRAILARILERQRLTSPPGISAPVDLEAVERIAPIDAVPAIAAFGRPAGSMQTGVFAETLAELLDSPNALALPDGRAFALQVIDCEETYDRSFGDHYSFDGIRAVFRGKMPGDPAAIDVQLRRPLAKWERILHTDRVRSDSFLFGVVATRIAYDASVNHDREDDRTLRIFARQLRSAREPSAQARRAAATLTRLPIRSSDWGAIRAAAENAVLAIVTPQPALPAALP